MCESTINSAPSNKEFGLHGLFGNVMGTEDKSLIALWGVGKHTDKHKDNQVEVCV